MIPAGGLEEERVVLEALASQGLVQILEGQQALLQESLGQKCQQ